MIEVFGVGVEHFSLRKVDSPGGKIGLTGRKSQSGHHRSETVEFPVHSLDLSFQIFWRAVRWREVTPQAGPPAYVIVVNDSALILPTVI